jgi:hypothetical protein
MNMMDWKKEIFGGTVFPDEHDKNYIHIYVVCYIVCMYIGI